MLRTFRALFTILIVALAAFGVATYLGFRSGYDAAAQTPASSGGNGLAAIDLRNIFNPGTTDEHLIATAFRQLERVYYKPVDAQTLIAGERVGIADYLRAKGVRGASMPVVSATGDQASDLRKIDGQLAYAQSHYARRLGTGGNIQITQAALRGMMSSLGDPYTVYLSPQEIQSLNESLNGGNFGGIGVYIYQLKDGQVILQPIEGLPAARAGMKPGEVVTSVDGTPVKGLMLDRVERMIRGESGTGVTIVAHPWKHAGQRAYRIVRDIIHVPTVRAKMENGYDYIRLSDFGETSADEVRAALLSGKAHGAKGYILDLRDNGGGLLDAAVHISSYFIPAGAIVSTIDRAGLKDQQNALGTAISGLRPLVVLVNKYTASASEITAGAIADYKVGTLIGTRTFGKGVVQSIYPMTDRSALKITTARYVTPAGHDIAHKGIAPDVLVNQNPDPALIDTPRDVQLAAAKAHLAAHRR